MKAAVLALLLAAGAWAEPGFRFRDVSAESVELSENGRPVYVYHHGLMKKAGVPEDRFRCCYVHPVYTPSGTVLTDDFPEDHYHHRGIFWTWPIVIVDGKNYDAWTLRGLRQEFRRWMAREATGEKARLAVENAWSAGGRPVVKETVEIAARPASGGSRELEFRLTFEAHGTPVELRGEPAENKGYGGFCVRFAPREKTAITTGAGREAGDSDMAPHAWARLEALFGDRAAGLRIDIDLSNPGFPNGWCLRHYGFLGVNFPGLASHVLRPDQPLELNYRVTVFEPGLR